MKSVFMILLVSSVTIMSQLLLKKGVNIITERRGYGNAWAFLLQAAFSPYVLSALALQVAGYVVWIFVISRLKLGVAFAISGAFFYILLALSGWYFFNEKLTVFQWTGILLITTGIICMNLKNG